MDITKVIEELKNAFPLFYVEACFQHKLEKTIRKKYPSAQIEREYNIPFDTRKRIDIVVELNGKKYPIELKYPVEELRATVNGENYHLRKGAGDLSSYSFLCDIERLEKVRTAIPNVEKCYCLLITNVEQLWSEKRTQKPSKRDIFRIHEGRTVSGTLLSELKDTHEINLQGSYIMHWEDYSKVSDDKNGKFRYLLIEI